MIRLLFSSFAAHLRSGRALFVLTLLGVALGVGSVLSIQILSRSALGAFRGSVQAVGGEADLTVLPRGPALPDEIFPRILGTRGVAAAWPVVRMEVALAGKEAFFLELIGLDVFAQRRLPWSAPPRTLSDALADPGWVAVTPSLARSLGWRIGDSFDVTSGSHRIRLKVGAVVDFQRLTPLASSRLAVMDIAQAQSLMGRKRQLDQVEVRVQAGASAAEVAGRLAILLKGQARIATPEQRRKEAEGLMGAFRLNLTALSLISLFVGTFLVYTSTRASLVRRRAELGVMRSLGATPMQVLCVLLAEVATLGFLGVLPGIALGYGVARAAMKSVSATLSNLYLLNEVEAISVSPGTIVLAGLLGILGALAGALAPSLEMSRKEIRRLLFPHTLHERSGNMAPRLFLAGTLLLAAVAAWYAAAGRTVRPGGLVLGFAIVLALPLLSPFVLDRLAGSLRGRSFNLFYGVKSLTQRLGITSVAAAALAVSVSMLVGVTVMIGSFRRTLEVWIASTVRADLYVSTESWSRARGGAELDAETLAMLEGRAEVKAIDRLRQVFTECAGRRVSVIGVDMALPGGASRFAMLEGGAAAAMRAARQGEVLVGDPLARTAGVKVGDLLPLT
ncbi:MAG TPA: ABC transporter permease, partial [Candidatus Polarisedimenticolia bacterium]|nr:ABC transporter permease [Candidatus Polarisedimenticolia bacterium]